ncbi:MAG: hypothetical protein JSS43_29410 [Proteobacteria bacterium]|nr:hypothetical protein [Pseudomonadota bacterium]
MGQRTYTILFNGDGSFSVEVNYGEQAGVTFVHGFKSDHAAETWAQNNKRDGDTIVWARPERLRDPAISGD